MNVQIKDYIASPSISSIRSSTPSSASSINCSSSSFSTSSSSCSGSGTPCPQGTPSFPSWTFISSNISINFLSTRSSTVVFSFLCLNDGDGLLCLSFAQGQRGSDQPRISNIAKTDTAASRIETVLTYLLYWVKTGPTVFQFFFNGRVR